MAMRDGVVGKSTYCLLKRDHRSQLKTPRSSLRTHSRERESGGPVPVKRARFFFQVRAGMNCMQIKRRAYFSHGSAHVLTTLTIDR